MVIVNHGHSLWVCGGFVGLNSWRIWSQGTRQRMEWYLNQTLFGYVFKLQKPKTAPGLFKADHDQLEVEYLIGNMSFVYVWGSQHQSPCLVGLEDPPESSDYDDPPSQYPRYKSATRARGGAKAIGKGPSHGWRICWSHVRLCILDEAKKTPGFFGEFGMSWPQSSTGTLSQSLGKSWKIIEFYWDKIKSSNSIGKSWNSMGKSMGKSMKRLHFLDKFRCKVDCGRDLGLKPCSKQTQWFLTLLLNHKYPKVDHFYCFKKQISTMWGPPVMFVGLDSPQ